MTSSITATGNLAIPLKLAADLVAASATFRTIVGAANATAALASIYEGESKAEAFPRCIIDWNDRLLTKNALTNWMLEGGIAILIEKEVTRAAYITSYQDEGRTFRNQMGAIESEMLSALIASPQLYPNVTEIQGAYVDLPEPDQKEGDYIFSGWLSLKVEGSAL